MTDLRLRTVELHCGCRPMFHPPTPAKGEWVSCLFHRRGGVVVAVDGTARPKESQMTIVCLCGHAQERHVPPRRPGRPSCLVGTCGCPEYAANTRSEDGAISATMGAGGAALTALPLATPDETGATMPNHTRTPPSAPQ